MIDDGLGFAAKIEVAHTLVIKRFIGAWIKSIGRIETSMALIEWIRSNIIGWDEWGWRLRLKDSIYWDNYGDGIQKEGFAESLWIEWKCAGILIGFKGRVSWIIVGGMRVPCDTVGISMMIWSKDSLCEVVNLHWMDAWELMRESLSVREHQRG